MVAAATTALVWRMQRLRGDRRMTNPAEIRAFRNSAVGFAMISVLGVVFNKSFAAGTSCLVQPIRDNPSMAQRFAGSYSPSYFASGLLLSVRLPLQVGHLSRPEPPQLLQVG